MESLKETFIKQIQEHQGIINKIVFLYASNPEDQKDLRQEVLTQAWRSYKKFRGDAKFSTWLYRIGLNVAISRLRKKSPEYTATDRVPEPSQNDSLSAKQLLETVLSLLHPIEKSLVLLLIEGYNQKEIAEIVGITPQNARVKIHRIRKKLENHGIKELVG